MENWKGKRSQFLATGGFEQVELTEPKRNLKKKGARITVLSLKPGEIKGWDHIDWVDKEVVV